MTKLTTLEQELSVIKPLVIEHDKILIRGNGEPSIQERMRNIERFIDEERKNREEEKETRKFYFRLTVSTVVANFMALIIAAVAWFIKIVPILNSLQNASF